MEEPGRVRVIRYTKQFGQLRGGNRQTDTYLEADQRGLVDVLDDRPSRNTRAASKTTPTSRFNVINSDCACADPAAMPAPTIVEAANVAIVDVVVTPTVRDLPMNAFTTNGNVQV